MRDNLANVALTFLSWLLCFSSVFLPVLMLFQRPRSREELPPGFVPPAYRGIRPAARADLEEELRIQQARLEDPDIAWLFIDNDDPERVAELQQELAVPITEVIKQAERKAIAEAYPLDGDPRQAEVVYPSADPFYSQAVTGVESPVRYQAYIELPRLSAEELETLKDRVSKELRRAYGIPPLVLSEPAPVAAHQVTAGWTLNKLADQRDQVWRDLMALAEQATSQHRMFTPGEQNNWQAMNEALSVLDKRIAHLRKFIYGQ